MGRITRAAPHLSEEEVLEKIKGTVVFCRVQKWLVITMFVPFFKENFYLTLQQGLHNIIKTE